MGVTEREINIHPLKMPQVVTDINTTDVSRCRGSKGKVAPVQVRRHKYLSYA